MDNFSEEKVIDNKLGFSVYFGLDTTLEDNLTLLEQARELGYNRIFTSLHIPEVNYTSVKEDVRKFLEIAKGYEMDVISDICPQTFRFLDVENMNMSALVDLGVKTVRVDFGYTNEEVAMMSHNSDGIKVQLNASTVTLDLMRRLEKYGTNFENVEALHNYYPRVGTGITEEYMIKVNEYLLERGISVGAFVQSNNRKRGPLKAGLPTLEDHRDKDVKTCANHLFALKNSFIFISDLMPSKQELIDLKELRPGEICLRIKLEVDDPVTLRMLTMPYTARIDEARDAIRTSESRLMLGRDRIEPANIVERPIGAVTLDNMEYGRYRGELQILKTNQPRDNKINVVAHVVQEDLHLLKYITSGRKFYFSIVK